MSELDPKSLIFSAALILFLLIGSAKLIIEELISLVILYKKLRATIRTTPLESAQKSLLKRGEPD
jgi:hypothetical protein